MILNDLLGVVVVDFLVLGTYNKNKIKYSMPFFFNIENIHSR